jgi:hypothetical protein
MSTEDAIRDLTRRIQNAAAQNHSDVISKWRTQCKRKGLDDADIFLIEQLSISSHKFRELPSSSWLSKLSFINWKPALSCLGIVTLVTTVGCLLNRIDMQLWVSLVAGILVAAIVAFAEEIKNTLGRFAARVACWAVLGHGIAGSGFTIFTGTEQGAMAWFQWLRHEHWAVGIVNVFVGLIGIVYTWRAK